MQAPVLAFYRETHYNSKRKAKEGSITKKEVEEVKEYWEGQESDGWGEGFEQREIKTPDGEVCVSFWNSGSDFFITTEEQLKGQVQEPSSQMGGMTFGTMG